MGLLRFNIINDIEKGIIERVPNGIPNGYSQAKLTFVKRYSDKAKKQISNQI